MQATDSCGRHPGTLWPGFSLGNQNNVGANGNGLRIDPGSLTLVRFTDANRDGVIADDDRGDGSRADGDTITIGGQDRIVHEVGRFTGSTFVHNGTTYTVPMVVWVFTDGTYLVRLNDADIPAGHWSRTEALQLGTWDGQDYSGTFVSTRDEGFFCFAAGTRIATPQGARPVETLCPGDLVTTLDHRPQPLRWVGSRRLRALATRPRCGLRRARWAIPAPSSCRRSTASC